MSVIAGNMKFKIRDGLRAIGLEVSRYRKRGTEKLPHYLDPGFAPIYQKYHGYTMIPWQGLYVAYSVAKHVALNNIPGSIVECGVWKGGCMAIMAETLAFYGASNRDFYLFDTFEGMPEPGVNDAHTYGEFDPLQTYNAHKKDTHVDWCYGPYEGVKALTESLKCPGAKFHLIKGKVEDTIPGTLPEKIAILRLDTDWYESTIHELNHMFPLLQEGGFLMVDDYGSWAGARKAVDEYFIAHALHKRMFLNVVYGHGSVIGQLVPLAKP
jgi:O-methyltransferase